MRLIAPHRQIALSVRDGVAGALTSSTSAGLGVRVRTARAWGFAGTGELTPAGVRSAARTAVRLARAASRTAKEPLRLTDDIGPLNGRYSSEVREDPFEVGPEVIVGLLADAERRLHVTPEVKHGLASFRAWEEIKWFRSSDGAAYRSRIVHTGGGTMATAIRGAEVQRRSYPQSFGGDFAQAGLEFFRDLALPEHSEATAKEALELLDARACPTGTTTLVLESSQLALQVHESVGHAVELDRIYGTEAAYAGTSWVPTSAIGTLRYGSDLMHVVADATEPGGLGTFGWDDEGVPGQRVPIVDGGTLVGVLSSRETGARLGLPHSGGTARADGPERAPLIRMTNIDLLPGDRSFEELIHEVDEGVYLATNHSWSIDDKRLNFQFGTEWGRRIVKGELAEVVRNSIYAGITPEFWGSLDAVGNRSTWRLWGVPHCGKGQPGQTARVSHGAPVGRFRNVSVRGG